MKDRIDELAYKFWSVHPREIDEWSKDSPPMPEGYKGGMRAWFFACHMRELIGKSKEPITANRPLLRFIPTFAERLSMRIGVAYQLAQMFWPFILAGALIATAPWIITYTIWSFK